MMGMELEEGGAHFRYSDHDGGFDPDIEFSYIDKKIHDVLGEYQRAFMGEVSAENLGARFGGYGSFLPAYWRSPMTPTHSRNESHHNSRSPINMLLEGTSIESVVTSDHQSRRLSSSNSCASQPAPFPGTHKALPSLSVPGKHNAMQLSSAPGKSLTDSHAKPRKSAESGCPPINGFVQNPLKFRLKMKSDLVLPRDNALIYSGLGLDMSPSSSLDDSPSEADEASPNMHVPEASPSSIVEIMTSFAIPNGKMISPLHDSLLHLMEYQTKLENEAPGNHEVVSLDVGHERVSSQRKSEINGERKVRQKSNNVEGVQIQKENEEGLIKTSCPSLVSGGIEPLVKKEAVSDFNLSDMAGLADTSTAAGHFFVSSGEKVRKREPGSDSVPHPESDLGDSGRTSGIGVVVKKEGDSSAPKSDIVFNKVNGDSSMGSTKKLRRQVLLQQHKREGVLESSPLRDSLVNDEKYSSKAEKILKNKKASVPVQRNTQDFDVPGMKNPISEQVESPVEKLDSKGSPPVNMEALPKGKEQSSSVSRKKPKKSHTDGRYASELKNMSVRVSSSPAQSEYTVLRIKLPSISRKVDMKPQRESRNLKDTSAEVECGANLTRNEKAMDTNNSMPGPSGAESRPSSGKLKGKADENAPTADSLQTQNPVVKDNWVLCEKCEKWRLLPDGLLPVSLPKKWICRMLNWLPGMNKCSVSEDDTTNALRLKYLVPASATEMQNGQPGCSEGGEPMTASVGTQHDHLPSHLTTLESAAHGGKNGFVQQLQSCTDNDRQRSAESTNPKKLSQSSPDLNSIQGNVAAKPFKREKKRGAERDASGFQKKAKGVPHQFKTEQSPAGTVSQDEVNDDSGRKRKLRNERDNQSSDLKEQCSMDNKASDCSAPRTRGYRGSEHIEERSKKRSRSLVLHENERFISMPDAEGSNGCQEDAFEDKPLVQRRGSYVSQKSLQGKKSSKRDSELRRPTAVAAASNSVKVASASKVKVEQHELNFSPVCSITSSPLRASRDHDNSDSKVKVTDFQNEPEELSSVKKLSSTPRDEKIRSVKCATPGNSFHNYDHVGDDLFAKSVGGDLKQISSMKHGIENGVEKQQKMEVYKDAHGKTESPFLEDKIGVPHQSLAPKVPGRRSFNRIEKVKLKNVTPSANGRGNPPRLSRCVSASEKGDGHVTTTVGSCDLKVTEQPEQRDGGPTTVVKHHNGVANAAEDVEASNYLRKDTSQNPAYLLKEAKELKHTADRLKQISSIRETGVVFFQAALKFLIAASLVEPGHPEASRSAVMISPSETYKSTADLCAYWAREFEKNNDMALAALAYKCMEVACMRGVYCNDAAASRDRLELQTAIRAAPPADSPSSSVSDLDNLNHQSVAGPAKEPHLPVVPGNPLMSAGVMPNLSRLLNFTHEVNRAMEATRKSQRAFSDAQSSLSHAGNVEGISSLKRVLDFGFLDLGGLLRLVSLAMEALSG